MTTADDGTGKLPWTGERYVPEIAGNIRLEHVHRYLLAQELSKGRQVLDIACGEGYGSELLARVAAGVVGVDIIPAVVQHAGRKYGRPGIAFVAGSCAAIPLAARTVDVVVSFETLEHHDQHDEMMREVKRVLRPGGLLIISSPDRKEYSEVPDYDNPFHARELYRDEFDSLLKRHFQQVSLIGQRVRAGSMVGPVQASGPTAFITFTGVDLHRTEGLHSPLYFIGVATDGALPAIPTGLLDGGDFLWPADHNQAVSAAIEQHKADVEPVAGQAAGTGVSMWRAEIDRHVATVVAVAAEKGQAEERSRWLLAENEQLRRNLGEVEQTRQALERTAAEGARALADARAELRAVEARANKALETERQRLADEQTALNRTLDDFREQHPALTAAISELETKVGIFEQSSSWRLTAPLRNLRRIVGRAPTLSRKVISDSARSIYRAAPLPPAKKSAVKGALFRNAPWLVGHTVAYRAWREQGTGSVAGSGADPVSHTPLPPAARSAPEGEYVPLTSARGVETAIQAIAFYVPNFHPTPDNDQWWGKGFTDWRNVARARPRFAGHHQPHVPGELGFYDLRLIDVQRRQIELAKIYGLHGFCYQHYWFNGRSLLRQPLDHVLAHPDLDFPFCVCWMNENWTRVRPGEADEILIEQRYSPEADLEFIRDIEPLLRDRRYIRIDGRPILILRRPELLPDAGATAARWRQHGRAAGLGDLFLIAVQSSDAQSPQDFGFDAALELPPNERMASPMPPPDGFEGDVRDYHDLVEYGRVHYGQPSAYPLFRSVVPAWDSTPQQPAGGTVFLHASPALYRGWLENACRDAVLQAAGSREPLVFINSWNDWVRGAHLEPDRRFGYAYLEATAEALRQFRPERSRPSIVVVSHDAHFFGAQRVALTLAQTLSGPLGFDVEVLLCGKGPLTAEFARAGRIHDFSSAASTPEVRERIVDGLYDRGARLALCNTSCVGEVVHLLKRHGFAVISMIHELPSVIREFGLETSSATIAADASRVVFPAAMVRDSFVALTGMPQHKAVVRPQGLLAANRFAGRRVDARRELRSRLGLDADISIALAVAPASHRKGIDLFVDAGLAVLARRANVVFVWVGNPWGIRTADEFNEAHSRLTAAGAEAHFRFPGQIEDPDVFFAGADIYMMTSREDPFPLVVLHALDAGIPVIGFDQAGGFVDLLQRGCGVLVPYLDTTAMAAAAVRLLDDPSEARRLGAAGKAIIEREFSFSDYARDLLELGAGPRLRVSVIVPNYNYARYLPARLRSILTQTYRPYEIIFLDDCSSDDSVEVADALLADGGIPYRIIRNQTNQGVYRQWLRGLQEASGDLVWIAEADDDCAPNLLEALVPSFGRDEITLAFCQSQQIDGSGQLIAPDYLHWTSDVDPVKWQHAYIRSGTDEIRHSLAIKNTIPNVSAVLMRKPDLSGIESLLVTLRNAGDWLVYVHLLERGEIAFLPAALNYHRRHAGSQTIGRGGLNLMREILLVQRRVLDRHQISPEVEEKRAAHLQSTYQYLGLDADGPAAYRDHEALKTLTAVAG